MPPHRRHRPERRNAKTNEMGDRAGPAPRRGSRVPPGRARGPEPQTRTGARTRPNRTDAIRPTPETTPPFTGRTTPAMRNRPALTAPHLTAAQDRLGAYARPPHLVVRSRGRFLRAAPPRAAPCCPPIRTHDGDGRHEGRTAADRGRVVIPGDPDQGVRLRPVKFLGPSDRACFGPSPGPLGTRPSPLSCDRESAEEGPFRCRGTGGLGLRPERYCRELRAARVADPLVGFRLPGGGVGVLSRRALARSRTTAQRDPGRRAPRPPHHR